MQPNTRTPDTTICASVADTVINRGQNPYNQFSSDTIKREHISQFSLLELEEIIESVRRVHEATLENGGPLKF